MLQTVDFREFNKMAAGSQISSLQDDKHNYRNYKTDFDYKAIAWHEGAFLNNADRLQLYTGSAGGGKSRLAAEKVHDNLMRYPGSMWLMVRKTRESMNNSTVLFYEHRIAKRCEGVVHAKSSRRFEYPNGSMLAYGGMKDEDQREQVRSIGLDGGLDGFWIEEANKLKFEDFQELLPRLRGKAAPFQLGLLSTNPDSPLHWIYTELIVKQMAKVYYSSAKDNPFNPPEYIDTLNMLTGIQKQRLVDGLWVQAEGAVYDNWSHENIDDSIAVYDPERPILWFCDDGYQHPRVVLIAQIKPDGRVVILDEYYRQHQLFDQTINDLLERPYRKPALAIYDPSAASLAANIRKHGIQTMAANNDVAEGIKTVRDYIVDGNGVRSLFISSKCTNLAREIMSYTYDDSPVVKGGDPKPVKENDDAVDALRYGIATRHGLHIPRGGFGRAA